MKKTLRTVGVVALLIVAMVAITDRLLQGSSISSATPLDKAARPSSTRTPKSPMPESHTAAALKTAPTTPPSTASSSASLNLSQWSTFLTNYAASGAPWFSVRPGESSLGTTGYDAQEFLPSHVLRSGTSVTFSASPGAIDPGFSWTSGVLSSYGHIAFDGGYLQITASIPNTNTGAWPAMWLVAGPNDTDNDEIDLFEGGLTTYDENTNYNFSGFIHTDGAMAGKTVEIGTNMSTGVHTYGISWVPGTSVTWYLDGKRVEEVTSKQIRIPSEPMSLVLDLQMARPSAAPWHTVASGSRTYTMHILRVQYSSNPATAP